MQLCIFCRETNDGGCVFDKQIRDFVNSHSKSIDDAYNPLPPVTSASHDDVKAASDDDVIDAAAKYTAAFNSAFECEYVVFNPAFSGSMYGVTVVQQVVALQKSTISMVSSNM